MRPFLKRTRPIFQVSEHLVRLNPTLNETQKKKKKKKKVLKQKKKKKVGRAQTSPRATTEYYGHTVKALALSI